PGRGAARQPEASLAWVAATSLVKRRQRMLKPCVSLDIFLPAEAFGLWNPGAASTRPPQARSLRLDRGPGAGQRHGTDRQGTCEIPFASTGATGRIKERRLINVPGLADGLHARQERLGEHERWRSAWSPQPKRESITVIAIPKGTPRIPTKVPHLRGDEPREGRLERAYARRPALTSAVRRAMFA